MKLTATDASLSVGVPLTKVNGTAELTGATRNGKLSELSGVIDLPSLSLTTRDLTTHTRDRQAQRTRRDDAAKDSSPNCRRKRCRADRVDIPDTGVSRYAMSLVLHNADVRQLTGESAPDVQGTLSASMALEGNWDDAASRRGRGDVVVSVSRCTSFRSCSGSCK